MLVKNREDALPPGSFDCARETQLSGGECEILNVAGLLDHWPLRQCDNRDIGCPRRGNGFSDIDFGIEIRPAYVSHALWTDLVPQCVEQIFCVAGVHRSVGTLPGVAPGP